MKTSSITISTCAVAIATMTLPAAQDAFAQGAFPSKNLVMIVPYTPGGSADVMSRAVAQRLGEAWGRNIVVDNRPAPVA